ncbi:MAG: response regulator [Planctomycetes bacterium]|nr:response regulator [Planctomycetota bacterium]
MVDNRFTGIRTGGALPGADEFDNSKMIAEFLGAYADSMRTILEKLEQLALSYEKGADRPRDGEEIMMALHCIKGESGMIHAEAVVGICHEAESAFEEMAEDDRAEMILSVKDWVEGFVGLVGNDPKPAAISNDEIVEQKTVKRCLVVDDEEDILRIEAFRLKELGYDVVSAANGRDAIEEFEASLVGNWRYDLVCLDIMMPDIDGLGVLHAIRQLEEEVGIRGLDGVKVVMATAKSDSATIMKSFREGCEGYVTKPATKEKLLAEMKKLELVTV